MAIEQTADQKKPRGAAAAEAHKQRDRALLVALRIAKKGSESYGAAVGTLIDLLYEPSLGPTPREQYHLNVLRASVVGDAAPDGDDGDNEED